MLWTKQFYSFEADTWLEEHHSHPLLGQTGRTRNQDWYHMVNDDVISMPDKWEYPWYAAWDLAFHCIALSAVDTDLGPYGVRIDNLLSISRSLVGGGSVPRSESPDGAGSYRTAPRGPFFRRRPGKA